MHKKQLEHGLKEDMEQNIETQEGRDITKCSNKVTSLNIEKKVVNICRSTRNWIT